MVPRASWDIIWWDCVWAQSTPALTYLDFLVMRKNPAPRWDEEGQMMPSAGERDLYFSTASLSRVWRDGLKVWWLSGEGQWHHHMGSRGEGKGVNPCWIPNLGGHSGQNQRLIWEFSWHPPNPGLLFAVFPRIFFVVLEIISVFWSKNLLIPKHLKAFSSLKHSSHRTAGLRLCDSCVSS